MLGNRVQGEVCALGVPDTTESGYQLDEKTECTLGGLFQNMGNMKLWLLRMQSLCMNAINTQNSNRSIHIPVHSFLTHKKTILFFQHGPQYLET